MTKRLGPFLLVTASAAVWMPIACGGGVGTDQTGGGSGGVPASGGRTASGGLTAGGGGVSTGGAPAAGGTASGGDSFGGLGGESGDFFPERLKVTTSEDGCWQLVLTAFTLKDGPGGLELYAAVRNGADEVTCAVQLAVELFDEASVSVAAAVNVLKHPSHFVYPVTADTSAIVACLGPGETAMGVVTDFPSGLGVEDVALVSYRCPSLKLDGLEPIDSGNVTGVAAVPSAEGTVYRGSFNNDLQVPLSGVQVWVFPTTASGRPLGMATALSESDVPAESSRAFQTDAVSDAGAGQAVFFDFDNPL